MNLYSLTIMDHYHHPRNVGKLDGATHKADEVNTSCGDKTRFGLRVENDKLKEIKHETRGCLVAIVSASVLSEKIIGKSTKEIKEMKAEDLMALIGMELTTSRIRCAMLPLLAIQKALKGGG